MTPQEAADEDRMVTQAEYGAEIEAETTEKRSIRASVYYTD